MTFLNSKNCIGKSGPNWASFRCRPAELRLSFPISEINNYDGAFYSRPKCETEAKKLLSQAYSEASLASDPQNLYNIAYKQIVEFAELGAKGTEGSDDTNEIDGADEAQKANMAEGTKETEGIEKNKFRAEIEEGLKITPIHQLKDFKYYYDLVEYECYESCEDTENWFSALVSGSLHSQGWNYSGYEAYLKIEKDFRFIADKYAMAATRVAFRASKKLNSQKD